MISTINFERGGEHLELGVYSKIFTIANNMCKFYVLSIEATYVDIYPIPVR